MAKAKKPISGSNSTSETPKEAGVKPDATVPKATDAAGASEAKDTPVKSNTQSAEVAKAVTSSSIPKTSKSDTKTSTGIDVAPSKSAPKLSRASEVKRTTDAQPETKKATENAKDKLEEAQKEKPVDKVAAKPAEPKREKPASHVNQKQEKSAFWPLVLGGLIAGGLGFVVSEMNVLNTRVDTTEVREMLGTQQDRIATLENAEPPTAPIITGLEDLQTSVASLSDMVTTLETRMTELEKRPTPIGNGSGPSPEYSQELAALHSSVEEQNIEIQQLLKNALSVEEATAKAAQEAAIQVALTKIATAIGAGSGFSDAVDALSDSGIDEVPAALVENAAGVATLLTLQTEFPANARAALSSARAAGVDDGEAGFGSFLKRQLGARSVAPREGSDPDAILSRAEAAVREGRITDALNEIDTLPAAAQDAMADWLTSARALAATQAAVQDLSQRLTAN